MQILKSRKQTNQYADNVNKQNQLNVIRKDYNYDTASMTGVNQIDVTQWLDSADDFKIVYNLDVIANSIRNLMLTFSDTYVFNPNYGAGIYKYLFELNNDSVRQSLVNKLQDQISIYDERIQVVDLEIADIQNKSFNIKIKINYDGNNIQIPVWFDGELMDIGMSQQV